MERIFVTGLGVITAIGHSLEENRLALAQGKCGIGKTELLNSRYTEHIPTGEIKIPDEAFMQRFGITRQGVNRTTLISLHALKEAIDDAGLSAEMLSSEGTALVTANTVGGMSFTDELYHDAHVQIHTRKPFLYDYVSHATTDFLKDYFGIGGLANTINTACSSSANAIIYAARLIQHGLAERAIAGGGDCLSKFTVNGFHALHILSPQQCRPFDKDRNGLNLGEGAAFVVLEKEKACNRKKVYAALSGFCNANDAYHPTALSDEAEGPVRVMQGALLLSKLQPADIGFINAHGTGTENNDLVESRAILKVFPQPPPFGSSKANVGHTLGASGTVEAVFSILSLFYQELYPQPNFHAPIEETGLTPVTTLRKVPFQHIMSNSFGFGGNCSSLIFSRV
ncbi:MAG: beta-ACP synthase [Chitinophagales bacterium]|nr:MAG: beta-ACP synthase [Chitinophagales bacterium]